MEPDFSKLNGLIPAIAQDYKNGKILMVGFMDREAWLKTLECGKATYFSRSRQKLWTKGETSGNVQLVKEILLDCDLDTVLLKVEQLGGVACHKGYNSCFFRTYKDSQLVETEPRLVNPDDLYSKGKK